MPFKAPCLAFKLEDQAIKYSSGLGNFFERAIVKVTGGKRCHVAIWISGDDPYNALCHESVEPSGTHNVIYNLTEPIWELVQLPTPYNSSYSLGWAAGDNGRPYGKLTIVGIGTDQPRLTDLDSSDRICSEDGFLYCRDVIGMTFPKEVIPGMVAPDGQPRGGWGLYELVQQLLSKGA